MSELTDFQDLLKATAKRLGSKQKLAAAIGITPGRVSRLLGGEYSMEVLNCLRLSKITGESADTVLRIAGKAEIADLLGELYGDAVHRGPTVPDAIADALQDADRAATLIQVAMLPDSVLAWLRSLPSALWPPAPVAESTPAPRAAVGTTRRAGPRPSSERAVNNRTLSLRK